MAIHNLATVFAPNLIKPPEDDLFSMVHDTPQINGLINTLILHVDYIFADFLIAEALYDYLSQGDDQISLKKGNQIKVKEEGDPKGWWTGEILSEGTEKGKKGIFPGSFVKIIFPTEKSGKQIKEMQTLQEQFKLQKKLIEDLKIAKIGLKMDLENLEKLKNSSHEEYLGKLQFEMGKIFAENEKLGIKKKIEGSYGQLEGSFKTKVSAQQAKQNFVNQLQQFKKAVHTDPKFKKFRGTKLGDSIDTLLENLLNEDKHHAAVDEKKEQIMKSLTQLRLLVKYIAE